jgi:hypothetical protein
MATDAQRLVGFGRVLRTLRGSRAQEVIVDALNEELTAAGEDEKQRIKQPMLSAYENGLNRPHRAKLVAMERHWGLTAGSLSRVLDGDHDDLLDDPASLVAALPRVADESRSAAASGKRTRADVLRRLRELAAEQAELLKELEDG